MTARQLECFAAVHNFIEIHKQSPTLEEIAQRIGGNRSQINNLLDHLEDRGWITRQKYASRNIKIRRIPEHLGKGHPCYVHVDADGKLMEIIASPEVGVRIVRAEKS